MGTKPKTVAIIGGSIAGLMHGVVLKSLGYEICIFEARDPSQLKAQAAGLGMGPHAQELMERFIPELDKTSYSLATNFFQFVTGDGSVISENKTSVPSTCSTWSMIFEFLKKEFEKPLNGKNSTRYLTGKGVTSFTSAGNVVSVNYQSSDFEAIETFQADLIIAADGAYSKIRKQLTPAIEPNYAGMFAWRGNILENQIPTELHAVLDGRLLMHRADGSYLLAYLTPGPNGNSKGNRLLDWVWYDKAALDSPDFQETMTDKSGRLLRVTVPRGALREVVWAKRIARARNILSPAWLELVLKAEFPFVTAVTGFESETAVFLDGKLLLVGEAFTQFQPFLGLGCNLPALQALTLLKVLNGEETLQDWDRQVVSFAKEFALRSIATGQFGMTGSFPEGYIPLYQLNKSKQAQS